MYHCEVCRAWVVKLKEGVIVTSCLAAWHLAEGHPLVWSPAYDTPVPHAENAKQEYLLLYTWLSVQPSACATGVSLQGYLQVSLGGVATGALARGVSLQGYTVSEVIC